MARRVNYLNNKDLLKEIAKSKNTYSYYLDESYEIKNSEDQNKGAKLH